MFLINAQFRPSRVTGNTDKPGVVYYRITERTHRKVERMVNSSIKGLDDSILETERERIDQDLRLLYTIIEHREESGKDFTIDNIVADFRLGLNGAPEMSELISQSKTDRPFRSDIVSVGRMYRDDFKYICKRESDKDSLSLPEFIFAQVQELKRAGRTSRSRAFLATMSNLRDFTSGNDILIKDVDRHFVENYGSWLSKQNIAETTQSFYLRTLRSILRQAAERNLADDPGDWFRNVNIRIDQSGRGTLDRALDRETLGRIAGLNLRSEQQLDLVRDMFMFGFYCRGMELVDIVNLEPENVKDGFLVYRRRLKGLENRVPLGEQALTLINKYRKDCQRHLFPILDSVGSILFPSVRNNVAKAIKEIGRKIGCPELSFNMNIGTWKALMSQVNISELLFFGAS